MHPTGLASIGRLERIWVKRAKRGPMDLKEEVILDAGRGIAGNANRGGRRQVTIIEREAWERHTSRLDAELDPSARRANLMVSGIALARMRGRILRIGECRIAIRGETRPCERMDEALPGLRNTMDAEWGGGAFGEVLDDGRIRVGDRVSWDEEPAPPLR